MCSWQALKSSPLVKHRRNQIAHRALNHEQGKPIETTESTINRCHDRIGVAPAQELSWRRGVVEGLHLCRIEPDGLGGEILFQEFAALGTGNGHDVVALV